MLIFIISSYHSSPIYLVFISLITTYKLPPIKNTIGIGQSFSSKIKLITIIIVISIAHKYS